MRDPDHGLVRDTAMGGVTTSQDYNTGFGELDFFEAFHGGSLLYREDVTIYDALGRGCPSPPSVRTSTWEWGRAGSKDWDGNEAGMKQMDDDIGYVLKRGAPSSGSAGIALSAGGSLAAP